MILVSSCSCLCPIHWSQVWSREWRCSWSSADRRCSNYIWVKSTILLPTKSASYIRGLTVRLSCPNPLICENMCTIAFFSHDYYRCNMAISLKVEIESWAKLWIPCALLSFTGWILYLWHIHKQGRSVFFLKSEKVERPGGIWYWSIVRDVKKKKNLLLGLQNGITQNMLIKYLCLYCK